MALLRACAAAPFAAALRHARAASSHFLLPPSLFAPATVDPETAAASAAAVAASSAAVQSYELPPAVARANRLRQIMEEYHAAPAKPERHDRRVSLAGGGHVDLSIFRPALRDARGCYLHLHGGGWYSGSARFQNDVRLGAMAHSLGLAVVSVDYRLAPEAKWPLPLDDCVAAARWLIDNSRAEFGSSTLLIGGESSGAHLCAMTLLRLASEGVQLGGGRPFAAANLVYGIYDLSGTPSVQHYGARPLIFNLPDFERCCELLLPPETSRRSPDVSPLYASPAALRAMPPALFTIGTDDPLLDDSMFMAARWAVAGSELAVYPGGAHGIGHFGPHANTALGLKAQARILSFLQGHIQSSEQRI
ncbi:hypothetical protein AB1Y20_009115 [Prymnesium parvum]|uniref:Alpha/beta hydrolase fold-3 domain-containing protein n=1 Tax=Prymnesium parvum TaxID=97485 RepID=A0AB34K0P4_PRYPA